MVARVERASVQLKPICRFYSMGRKRGELIINHNYKETFRQMKFSTDMLFMELVTL